MKLHLLSAEECNQVTACGPGYVDVNGKRYTSSVIVFTDEVLVDWGVTAVTDLEGSHFKELLSRQLDVILLGTGSSFVYPEGEWLQDLVAKKIGLEAMDTAAACRTFNLLASDGRTVAAALIVDGN